MVSEHKKNSKLNKNIIDAYNYRLKTIVKMSKNEKNLTIIQYFQSTFNCYAIVNRDFIPCSKLSINNELHNKTFKLSNKKFLKIKKISPKQLLEYLQQSEDINYLMEDLHSFGNFLDIEHSDDINFYVKKYMEFLNDIDYFTDVITCLAKYDFINRFFKLKSYLDNISKKNLNSIFINLFEQYINNLEYLPEKFYNLSISNVTSESNSLTLQLPKNKVFIEKSRITNRKKQYYSKISHTTLTFYINTLNEFIDTLVYFIIYHNITIKKCKHCDRLFIPSRKDAMFCKNPSPERPSRTCQDIRTHFSKYQTQQNAKIQALYDKIETICNNKKKKYPEYKIIWQRYKIEHHDFMEDIYHYRAKRKQMIEWQKKVIQNPEILLPKKEAEPPSNITDNFDFMELHNKLIKEAGAK